MTARQAIASPLDKLQVDKLPICLHNKFNALCLISEFDIKFPSFKLTLP